MKQEDRICKDCYAPIVPRCKCAEYGAEACAHRLKKELKKKEAIIDELEKENVEFREDRKNASGCSATYWKNYGEKVAQCHIDAEDKINQLEKELRNSQEHANNLQFVADKRADKLRSYEEAVEPIEVYLKTIPSKENDHRILDERWVNEKDTVILTYGDLRRLVEIREGK